MCSPKVVSPNSVFFSSSITASRPAPAPRCYLVWHYQFMHLIFETEERFFPQLVSAHRSIHCDLTAPSPPSVCFPSHYRQGGMFSPLPRHEASPGPTSLSAKSLKEGVVSTWWKISFSSRDKKPREQHYLAIEGNKHACYNMNLKNMMLSESSLMSKAHIVWFNFYETPRKGKSEGADYRSTGSGWNERWLPMNTGVFWGWWGYILELDCADGCTALKITEPHSESLHSRVCQSSLHRVKQAD